MNGEKIKLKINSIQVEVKKGSTILDAAKKAGVKIPTLCHIEGIPPLATCRICQVEDLKRGVLVASCATPAQEGMEIATETEKVINARKMIIELFLSSHPETCLVCDLHGRCELRKIAGTLGIGTSSLEKILPQVKWEYPAGFIKRDLTKCILCGRCIHACREIIVQGAIDYTSRGFSTMVTTEGYQPLSPPDCIQCGLCVALCPTGALENKNKRLHRQPETSAEIICNRCGCGCELALLIEKNKVVERTPAIKNGKIPTPCSKGIYGEGWTDEKQPVKTALVRDKLSEPFEPIKTKDAIKNASARIKQIISSSGAEAVALWCSPLASCEEGYMLQMLARQVIKTPYLDLAGSGGIKPDSGFLREKEGVGYPSVCSIDDITNSDLIVVIGDELLNKAPVVEYAIRRAVRSGSTKLIYIGSREEGVLSNWAHRTIITSKEMIPIVISLIGKVLLAMVSKYFINIDDLKGEMIDEYLNGDMTFEGIKTDQIAVVSEEIFTSRRLIIVVCFEFTTKTGKISFDIEEAAFLAHASWHSGREMAGIIPANAISNEIGLIKCGLHPGFNTIWKETSESTEKQQASPALYSSASAIGKIKSGQIKALITFGRNTLEYICKKHTIDIKSLTMDYLKNLDVMITVDSTAPEGANPAHIVIPMAQHEQRDGLFIPIDGIERYSAAAVAPDNEQIWSGVDVVKTFMEEISEKTFKAPQSLHQIRQEMKEKSIIALREEEIAG